MRFSNLRASLLLVSTMFLAIAGTARAGSDPAKKYRTIRTPHARIHHDVAGEPMARRAAALVEQAYSQVSEFLGLAASQPLEMVLTDDGDTANGNATVYPYDRVVLYAAPPEPGSDLATFDDYLRILVLHEYVHIAQMDTVSGFPAFVNRLLGKTVMPNSAMNSWFVEGVATFLETRMTGWGRVGSTGYERILRMAVLGGTFLNLSEMTIPPLKLPRAGAAYVYGGAFLEFLHARGGTEGVRRFVKEYGARIIPFASNTVARRVWGSDFLELYEEFKKGVEEKVRKTTSRIQADGPIEGSLLTHDGESKISPVFRPDGKAIWYIRSDGSTESGVFEHDIRTGVERRRWDCRGGCGRLAVADDAVFTTHAVPSRIYASFGDVYRLGPKAWQSRRLTRRSRARDIAAAHDGALAWVTAEYDSVSLVVQAADGTQETRVQAGRFDSIGDPTMLPDGRVVFAGASDGRWDLWAARPDGTLDRLTDDGCLDRDPVATPDGKWLLFTSDPRGIDDILALDMTTGQRRRVTRVLGGAAEPAVSPDGSRLVFKTYSAKGWDLAIMPLDPSSWEDLGPDDTCRKPTASSDKPSPADAASTTYSAWPSIRPRALHPRFSATSAGDVRLGASVDGLDALGHHAFNLGFDADVRRGDATASGSYRYLGWWLDAGIDVATWASTANAFVDNRNIQVGRRFWLLNVELSIPVPLRSSAFSFGIGYSVRWITGSDHPRATDPATSPPRLPSEDVIGGLTLNASHDSTVRFTRSIGPAQGLNTGLSVGVRHPIPAANTWAFTVTGYAFGYLPMPWKGNQVLAILASGAASFGNRALRDIWAVGGFPPQNLFTSLVNREPMQGRYLRGVAQGTFAGDAYTLMNIEYRAPLWYIHRGLGTFPIAANRLWATVFADVGGAWWRDGKPRIGWDAGLEVALSTNLFLVMNATFRLGYAHGFGTKGADVVYFLFTP